jgi:hypothetical protein
MTHSKRRAGQPWNTPGDDVRAAGAPLIPAPMGRDACPLCFYLIQILPFDFALPFFAAEAQAGGGGGQSGVELGAIEPG